MRLTGSTDLGLKNLLTLRLEELKPPPPSDVLNQTLSSSPSLQVLKLIHVLPRGFVSTFQWSESMLQDCHIESTLVE